MPVIDLAFALGRSARQGLARDIPLRLNQDLRSLQVKLRIEQAGAEAFLRDERTPRAATDQSRKEIAQVEDQLAVPSAQQKAVESGCDARSDDLRGPSNVS